MKHKPSPGSRPPGSRSTGRRPAQRASTRADELYQAVRSLRTLEEVRRFFADLCTPAELEALADRWAVARLVDEGIPYRAIHDRTGVSTATVTRVGRSLTQGENGYRTALDRLARRSRSASQ